MKHSKLFEDLIENCVRENQFVGLGNPGSNILFVGKEAGIEIEAKNFHGSGESWKNPDFNYALRYCPETEKHKSGAHTWQKYQLLYELIREQLKQPKVEKICDYEVTFVEDIFTTELSNLHAPESNQAKQFVNFKEELIRRKQTFWSHPFIDCFSVVVIFASDNNYIETFPGEVQQLFKVQFINQQKAGLSKIWVNKSTDGKRIVIHTRQLTNGASRSLIQKIAEIIAEFMKNKGISFLND